MDQIQDFATQNCGLRRKSIIITVRRHVITIFILLLLLCIIVSRGRQSLRNGFTMN